MKNRKAMAEIGVVFLIGIMTAGCAGTVQDVPQTEEREISLIDDGQEDDLPKDAEQKDTGEEEEQEADLPKDAEQKDRGEEEEQEENEKPDGGQSIGMSEGTEHLGGKVQSTQEDGMIFAQTALMDEDGSVTLLEVKDAKKIPVKFTADTKVEHWTIQGGGAGIDRKEAALSDLQEGMGVELEGYFEGETFVAVRVIIEVYV